jgi:hypothetical protein
VDRWNLYSYFNSFIVLESVPLPGVCSSRIVVFERFKEVGFVRSNDHRICVLVAFELASRCRLDHSTIPTSATHETSLFSNGIQKNGEPQNNQFNEERSEPGHRRE